MVAFIMLGMAKFHENSKIKPGVTRHTMRDVNFLEGWITYDTLCTHQVLSNSEGVRCKFF